MRGGSERRSRAPEARGGRETVAVAAVLLAAAVLVGAHEAVGSELRYVLAAREMAVSGDFVVPHLAGVPYMEKPILFYWLAAGAQVLLGASVFAARLPSLLSTVVLGLVTHALARELGGRRFALRAVGVFVCSLGVMLLGTSLTTDPVFAASLALAWYAAWRVLRQGGFWPVAAFWTALAAALLAKGPLGPALVVAAWLPLAIAERSARSLLRFRPVLGSVFFLALCAPWHVAAWQRDPRLLEFFYVRQNLQAAVDENVNHAGPAWFYVPALLAVTFPFSIIACAAAWRSGRRLVAALWGGARNLHARHRLRLYLACGIFGPLILLSAAASKLGSYVLPLLPFVVVLVARELDLVRRRPGTMLRCAAGIPAAAVWGGLAVGVPGILSRYDLSRLAPAYVPVVAVGTIALAFGLLVAARRAFQGRRDAFVPMAVGALAFMGLVTRVAGDPGMARNAAAIAGDVAATMQEGDVVVASSGRIQDYAVNLAIPTRIVIVGRGRELGFGHFVAHTPPDVPVPPDPYGIGAERVSGDPWMIDVRGLARLWDGSARVFYFADEKDVRALRRLARTGVHVFADDGKHVVFTNR